MARKKKAKYEIVATDLKLPDLDWFSLDWKPWPPQGGYAMIVGHPEAAKIAATIVPHPGKTYLSRVEPGNPIPAHTDAYGMRIHVPLVTNSKAFFILAGQKFHMELGKAYKIDSGMPHGVVNDGDEDRIHLIFHVR